MMFTISPEVLAPELVLLQKIAASKPTLPALASVLVEAEHDGVRLSATDLDHGIVSTCKAHVHRPGRMLLPIKTMADLCSTCEDNITIALEGTKINVTSGLFTSQLRVGPLEDFPKMPTPPETVIATLLTTSMKLLLMRAKYAISDKMANAVLKSALLTVDQQRLIMVATDGKRISVSSQPSTTATDGTRTAILPQRPLLALIAQLDTGDVQIRLDENYVYFTNGSRVLFSRLVDGQFPSWQRIVPREHTREVSLDRRALASALRRVLTLADESQIVTMEFDGVGLILSVTAGNAAEKIAVTGDCEPITLQTHGSYILDFAEHASNDAIRLRITDKKTALLWIDSDEFLNVITVAKQ